LKTLAPVDWNNDEFANLHATDSHTPASIQVAPGELNWLNRLVQVTHRKHFQLQLHRARRRRDSNIYQTAPFDRYGPPLVAYFERQFRREESGVQRNSGSVGYHWLK
jgi:hypothetical protein